MKSFQAFLHKLKKGIESVCTGLAILDLLVIVVVMNVAIFYRYFLRRPIAWSSELSTSLFFWLTYLGAVIAMLKQRLMGTDLLVKQFPAVVQKIVEYVKNGVIIVVFIMVANASWDMIGRVTALTPTLKLPQKFLHLAIFVGLVLMIIVKVIETIELIVSRETDCGKEAN